MRLDLRASPLLTFLAAALHSAAATVLWFFLPPPAGALAAVLVVALAALALRQRTLLWATTAPVSLELKREGRLVARLRNRTELEGQVSARRYVSRWLVVLDLAQAPWGRRTILIARDMLPAGQFRHLRLWALWDAQPAARPAANLAQDAQ